MCDLGTVQGRCLGRSGCRVWGHGHMRACVVVHGRQEGRPRAQCAREHEKENGWMGGCPKVHVMHVFVHWRARMGGGQHYVVPMSNTRVGCVAYAGGLLYDLVVGGPFVHLSHHAATATYNPCQQWHSNTGKGVGKEGAAGWSVGKRSSQLAAVPSTGQRHPWPCTYAHPCTCLATTHTHTGASARARGCVGVCVYVCVGVCVCVCVGGHSAC